jgi:hypothetical protein
MSKPVTDLWVFPVARGRLDVRSFQFAVTGAVPAPPNCAAGICHSAPLIKGGPAGFVFLRAAVAQ